jgi:uncharacterized protein HemX
MRNAAVRKQPTKAQQRDWLERMTKDLETLHKQWYGIDKAGIDRDLFNETDHKVREACRRLGLTVEDVATAAERNEGWDGEMHGDIVVLQDALREISRRIG